MDDYEKLDELLEQRYEHDIVLDDEEEQENALTFGSVGALDEEFDFTHSTLSEPDTLPPKQNNVLPSVPNPQMTIHNVSVHPQARMMSLEEIEAQMRMNRPPQPPMMHPMAPPSVMSQMANSFPRPSYPPPPSMIPSITPSMIPSMTPSMMTMEDVERMMRMNLRPMTSPMVSPMTYPMGHIQQQGQSISIEPTTIPPPLPHTVEPLDHQNTNKPQTNPNQQLKEIKQVKETQETQEISYIEQPIEIQGEQDKPKRPHMAKLNKPTQAERKKNQSNPNKQRGNRDYQHHQFQHETYSEKTTRNNDLDSNKGLMAQWEKEWIAKIQISQLVSDDPFKDDFYYQIYTQITSLPTTTTPLTEKMEEEKEVTTISGKGKKRTKSLKSNSANKMQQQMQKLIEKRRSSKKGTELSLEGALGKVPLLSSRQPRQALQLVTPNTLQESEIPFTVSHLSTLKNIERVYDLILQLDDLKRQELQEGGKELQESLLKTLQLSESVPLSRPHSLGFFLKYTKGMRILPRIIQFLDPEHVLLLFTTLLSRLECVEMANLSLEIENEKMDDFMNIVIPCLVDFVNDIPLGAINLLVKTILERHPITWVTKSRIGLAILTMLLSRAEILKQLGSESAEDLSLWSEIYNFLFASMQHHFSHLFPSVESISGEIYIWQFLASLAVGATLVDQQKILVMQVRKNIIETAKRDSNPKALANVNLFLSALGLGIDASQLASMPI